MTDASSAPAGTLVLRGGAIGDFVVTLPILAALRERFPGERLAVACAPSVGPLAIAGGLAEETRDLGAADFATVFRPAGQPAAELTAWLRGFARVVSFLHDPAEALAGAVGEEVQFVPGLPRPRDGGGPATRQLLASVAPALGLHASNPADFRLSLPCAVHDQAELTLRTGRWFAVHPGSGSPRKNWPAARWVELLRQLLQADPGLRLLVLGGEADEAALAEVVAGLPPARVQMAAHRPLLEVAGLLAACERFLGHDSGLGHLAAALGRPALQLFGPSDATVWAPPQPRAHCLRAPGGDLHRLEVAEVLAALASADRP
ncbi:MAG: glycosyltransferase family 9 protein [Verrucomicrobia bacterium]|nr:glycosyltransferase family 9 protein [Verrucomicrobiota bacterium]